MIEKGLTMIPRREEFALGYLAETVDAYTKVILPDAAHNVGAEELDWIRSVLDEYWDATMPSRNPIIRSMRERVLAVEAAVYRREDLRSGPHSPTLSSSPVPVQDLLALAERRRSTRWFRDAKVPRSVIDTAVRTAMEAPSACNRQPYRFIIADTQPEIQRLAAIPMGTRGYREQIPGLIVVVGDLSAFFDPRDRHLIYVDSSLASMSLVLSLEAQNIATCCINWPDIPEREDEMATTLSLEPHERVIMLIAYGFARADALVPFSAKKDLASARIYWSLDD